MSDENSNEENQNEENQNEETNNEETNNQENDNQESNNQEYDSTKDGPDDAAENAEKEAKETGGEAKESRDEFKEGWDEVTKSGENKKLLAGILGIVVGGFGIHKFILGYNKEGFILLGALLISFPLMCIIVGAFTIYIPVLIGFIEGIIYLTKSDEEFYQTYQVNKRPWF